MFVFSLLVALLLLAMHPLASASRLAAVPSNSMLPRAPEVMWLGKRLRDSWLLVPLDARFYNEGGASWAKRAVFEETLAFFLRIRPLISIATDYRYGSRARQFAEELHHELWEGRAALLSREMWDLQRGILTEKHHFGVSLSSAAPPVVAFVRMLWETRKKRHSIVCKLVSPKVPQHAFDGTVPFQLSDLSLDEWPPALVNDQEFFKALSSTFERVGEARYFLMQSNMKWLKDALDALFLDLKHT